MKIIKIDRSICSYRVVELYAVVPTKIWVSPTGYQTIFLRKYYELQLDSFWGEGWLSKEQSFSPNYWDHYWNYPPSKEDMAEFELAKALYQ